MLWWTSVASGTSTPSSSQSDPKVGTSSRLIAAQSLFKAAPSSKNRYTRKKYDDGSLVKQLGKGFEIETSSAAMSFKNSHKKLSTRLLLV